MSNITDMASLVAAEDAAAGLNESWYKGSIACAANVVSSLWTANGNPGAGAAAGSNDGAICTKADAGAFTRLANAGAGVNHILLIEALGANIGTVMLYDRLWHSSGHNGTTLGPTSFTQPALTRYTGGEGVECWLDVYTAIGSTSRTATISFTHPVSGAGQSATVATIASQAAGQCVRFTGAATDAIVSVQSVGLSASTGTAGNYGLTLRKLLAMVPLAGPVGGRVDALRNALRRVSADACLELLVMPNTTTTGQLGGSLVVG